MVLGKEWRVLYVDLQTVGSDGVGLWRLQSHPLVIHLLQQVYLFQQGHTSLYYDFLQVKHSNTFMYGTIPMQAITITHTPGFEYCSISPSDFLSYQENKL